MSGDNLGWAVAMAAVGEALRISDQPIRSAYILGSLGHGGFSVSSSDVDVAFVLDPPESVSLPEDFTDLLRTAVKELPTLKSSRDADPLVDRLSIFHCSLNDLRDGTYPTSSRWPLLDRVDLLTSGVCVHGPDTRTAMKIPPHEDIAKSAINGFMKMSPPSSFESSLHAAFMANDLRKLCKTILFPVRMAYTVEYRRVVSNVAASSWMAAVLRNRFPLTVCDWRTTGFNLADTRYPELEEQSRELHDAVIDFVVTNFPSAADQLEHVRT